MPFKAKKPPQIDGTDFPGLKSDVRDLAKYADDEFAEVASAFQNPDPMQVRTVVPPKPRTGMLVYADGTHWNPGSGEGLYVYNSSGAWVPLFDLTVVGAFFSAHLLANQTVSSGVFTKIHFETKEVDTYSWYDATTNFRFQPTIAGYYELSGSLCGDATTISETDIEIRFNGTTHSRNLQLAAGVATNAVITRIIHFNGSTDFAELFGDVTATAGTPVFFGGTAPIRTWFQAKLLR